MKNGLKVELKTNKEKQPLNIQNIDFKKPAIKAFLIYLIQTERNTSEQTILTLVSLPSVQVLI